MSVGQYSLETLILIVGLVYICHLIHLSMPWTVAIAILLVGGGLIGAVNSVRQRDHIE